MGEAERKLKGKKLYDILEDEGFEPRSYSGRGMFGRNCVSVHSSEDESVSLWQLAASLAAYDIPEPITDQLGLGYVYYWPSYEWPDGVD